jgi:acetaldehyde dehydrogenase
MRITISVNLYIVKNSVKRGVVMEKVKVAIVGPGNIGTDLLIKIRRSKYLELDYVVGIKESDGLRIAREMGIKATSKGIKEILDIDDIKIVFDATGAKPHLMHAPLLKEKGKFAIDLTPAAVGPFLIPAVNLNKEMLKEDNVNMVTCGGQATIPIVAAINEVADVEYAEIVSSISSLSAGPGTRQNIDEFTVTTKKALEKVGGADKAKVIIVLNPADPPIYMRNTIYTIVRKPDLKLIKESVDKMVESIKHYVPGYKLLIEPIMDGNKVTVMVQVEGLGDYLPKYAGNLDIINCAAVRTAEVYAAQLMGVNK